MHIVGVDKLAVGDVLGKSLFNERSELLLAAGYRLNEEMIGVLRRHGFQHVLLMDDVTEIINPENVIKDSVCEIVSRQVAYTFQEIREHIALESFSTESVKKRIEMSDRLRGIVALPEIRAQVGTMIEEIIGNQITMFASLPVRSRSGAYYQHAVDTALLTLLIGQVFKVSHKEMVILGTAALLHDIGKMVFGSLLDKEPRDYTREERTVLREHPVYSMLILKGCQPTAYVEQTIVLQHHERFDGTGYPAGLKGTGFPGVFSSPQEREGGGMHRFSEILVAANAFDNYVTGVLDSTPVTPDLALGKIIEGSGTAYNPNVVRALSRIIQSYPIGSQVRIKNVSNGTFVGYSGVVIQSNPVTPTKPTLLLTHNAVQTRINPRIINLADESMVVLELMI